MLLWVEFNGIRHVLDQVAVPKGSPTACTFGAIVDMSGHGFLIASDSLTKHPVGPGIQPEEQFNIGTAAKGAQTYHSAPRCPFRHQLSPL